MRTVTVLNPPCKKARDSFKGMKQAAHRRARRAEKVVVASGKAEAASDLQRKPELTNYDVD